MGASFGGIGFVFCRLDPNPRRMIERTEDIQRTGLDGIEVKKFGKRPFVFTASVILTDRTQKGMDEILKALTTIEKNMDTLTYEGQDFENVELFEVHPGQRTTTLDGPVQRVTLTFRMIR